MEQDISDLAGIYRYRGECCLAQSDSRSQQVSGGSLILTSLQFQFLPGQHCFIARGITRRREELKLPMTPTEEESHPAGETGKFVKTRKQPSGSAPGTDIYVIDLGQKLP